MNGRRPIGLTVPYREVGYKEKKEWVSLPEEEVERLIHNFKGDPWSLLEEFETRLKIKNDRNN
jgi:hypothetical protein